MTIRAELADGRVLEFPDGTDPSVIQTTVKRIISAPAVQNDFSQKTTAELEAMPTARQIGAFYLLRQHMSFYVRRAPAPETDLERSSTYCPLFSIRLRVRSESRLM